ncbi:MAG: hypothetical protein Q8R37_00325 [Nanoarchaeota archaeon]|nr:hypothetical protein [Nanoarchaeota archaeon]
MEISELPVKLDEMIKMSLGDVGSLDVEVIGKIFTPGIIPLGNDNHGYQCYRAYLIDLQKSATVTLSLRKDDFVTFLLDKLQGCETPKNLIKIIDTAYQRELPLIIRGNYYQIGYIADYKSGNVGKILQVNDVELLGDKGNLSLVERVEGSISLADTEGSLSLKK